MVITHFGILIGKYLFRPGWISVAGGIAVAAVDGVEILQLHDGHGDRVVRDDVGGGLVKRSVSRQ